MNRPIVAAILCLPLCATAFGDTALQLRSTNQRKTLTVEATTWHGEKALRIPLAFNAGEWKKAGFTTDKAKVDKNAPPQIGYLYVTATAYQLRNAQGNALLGGPRVALELDKTSCIVMRSLASSVCGFLAVREGDDEATVRSNAFRQAHDFFRDVTRNFSGAYRTVANAAAVPEQPVYATASATTTEPAPAVRLYTEADALPEPAPAVEPAAEEASAPATNPASDAVAPPVSARAPAAVPASQPENAAVAAIPHPQPQPASAPEPAAEIATSLPAATPQPAEAPVTVATVEPAPAPTVLPAPISAPAPAPAPVAAPRPDPSEAVKALAREIQPTLADVAAPAEADFVLAQPEAKPARYSEPRFAIVRMAAKAAPAKAASVGNAAFSTPARPKSAAGSQPRVSSSVAGSLLYVAPVVTVSAPVLTTPVAAPASNSFVSVRLPSGPTAPRAFAQPAVAPSGLPALVSTPASAGRRRAVSSTTGFDVVTKVDSEHPSERATSVPDDLTPAGAPRGVNAEAPQLDAFKAVVTEKAPSKNHSPQLTTSTVFATATAKAGPPINPAQPAPTAAVDFEAPNTGSGSAQLEHGPVKQAALPSIIAK